MKRLLGQLLVLALVAGAAVGIWYHFDGNADQGNSPAGGPGGGALPVSVAAAQLGSIEERVEAVGTTLAREAIDIVSQVSGRVVAINFEEAQQVEAGTLLIELDGSREAAELREAIALRDDARRQLARARQLLAGQNVPQARVDELSAAVEAAEARVAVIEIRLEDRKIRAPFDGVVGLREVSLGAYVEPQRRLTTLDDVSRLRLDFAVPERFMARLSAGLPVAARSAAYPLEDFSGEIVRVGTRVDPVTRSIRVQAELPNEDRRLRPGMFMGVELTLQTFDQVVLVPEESIIAEGNAHFVFVVEDGTAQRRRVILGLRQGTLVEIREGVEAGEEVVTAGMQRLRDGSSIYVRSEAGV